MKKLWIFLVFVLLFALPFNGAAKANPGPNPGPTQTLSSYIGSWTKTNSSIQENATPLTTADPDKKAYLTFDDGPDPVWSPQVLAVLQKYQAHATFYMIGRNAATFQDTIVQIASAGNTLANHSYNHVDLTTLDYQNFALEVGDTEQTIINALYNHPDLLSQVTQCLRPPYGSVNNYTYSYAQSLGYNISLWNFDTRDWAGATPESILADFSSKLQPDRVILFHDGGKDRHNTILSLDLLLHELMMQGYQVLPFCTRAGQAVINH